MRWARLVLAGILVVGGTMSATAAHATQNSDPFVLKPAVVSEIESVLADAEAAIKKVDLTQLPTIQLWQAKRIEESLANFNFWIGHIRSNIASRRLAGIRLGRNYTLLTSFWELYKVVDDLPSLILLPTPRQPEAQRRSFQWAGEFNRVRGRVVKAMFGLELTVATMVSRADVIMNRCDTKP